MSEYTKEFFELLFKDLDLQHIHKLLHVASKFLFYAALSYLVHKLVLYLNNSMMHPIANYNSPMWLIYGISLLIALLGISTIFRGKLYDFVILNTSASFNLKNYHKFFGKLDFDSPYVQQSVSTLLMERLTREISSSISLKKFFWKFFHYIILNIILSPLTIYLILSGVNIHFTSSWEPFVLFSLSIFLSAINAEIIISNIILRIKETNTGNQSDSGTQKPTSASSGQQHQQQNSDGQKPTNKIWDLAVLLYLSISVGKYIAIPYPELHRRDKALLAFLLAMYELFFSGLTDTVISKQQSSHDEQKYLVNAAFVFLPSLEDVDGKPAKSCTRGTPKDSGGGKSQKKHKSHKAEAKAQRNPGDCESQSTQSTLHDRICESTFRFLGFKLQDISYRNMKNMPNLPENNTMTVCVSTTLNNKKKIALGYVWENIKVSYSEMDTKLNSLLDKLQAKHVSKFTLKDITKLIGNEKLKDNKEKEELVLKLFEHSIIDPGINLESDKRGEIEKRFRSLFENEELINNLGFLSEKFLIVLPIVLITSKRFNIPINNNRGGTSYLFEAHYCLPVLILWQPLMNINDLKEINEKIKEKSS
ncbi:MAG: hypothetical protein LM588_06650 [Fervidicoccaceae archaeon]|nr:hypothetical protein [Fervidicoccaceae archaeon]